MPPEPSAAQPPPDYEYDLFVSYKSKRTTKEWLDEDEFFYQLLVDYLSSELQRDPAIFIDRLRLNTGDKWKKEIERALLRSRCLLVIGTGDYFSSLWCKCEFETFADRSAIENDAEIIVPIQWHDWSPVPAPVGEIQLKDFRHLAVTGLKNDKERKIPFQLFMTEFCKELAEKILGAPPFNPAWRVVLPSSDIGIQPVIEKPRR